jgi:hypothetical protein
MVSGRELSLGLHPLYIIESPNLQKTRAKNKLQRRAETATPDKIVAELTFGFWSSLFNGSFQSVLWKDLRLVFPRCPKRQRQRHAIASALNQIRNLRNRIFHHEPLFADHPANRVVDFLPWNRNLPAALRHLAASLRCDAIIDQITSPLKTSLDRRFLCKS